MESDFTPFVHLENLQIKRIHTLLDGDDMKHVFVQLQYSDEKGKMDCYELIKEEVRQNNNMTNKKYKFNSTTLDYVNGCRANSNNISITSIKCNRINEIAFFGETEENCIATFRQGILQQ